ncbi:acyltransferase family protein [Stenotrophomonas sp. CFBP8980]|uniref:acyltransferase family protein n=1 Tax=Stenotrophomonas sp. CFBP8980 TaxID=3096523 RepID=UPI002A6AD5E4|nr:heparan-alpha-glucosaminide N-acetyltransferase domain-containing protein [Stenotrophomonas sp. CFBP8980]MDY1032633.1 heparan-alpha-glucosaminide N-acetyltransferase domain-containing protein [Stenotrophomonas sp. CFBP8980]
MSTTAGARLASIDALRGLTVAAMLLVNNPGDWGHVHAPLLHAAWHGCTPTDLVFPFFLFLVGVSMAFSVVPRAADVAARPALARGVLTRALRILLAGLLLHALAWWLLELPHYRLWGVLQRIAVCSALVGLLAVYMRQPLQWAALVLLLAGYSGLLLGADTLAPLLNPVSRLDIALFAPWIYQYDAATGLGHDPEGLMSTLGALATTLLGLLTGQQLRAGRALRLAASGALLLAVGLAAAMWLPLNKNLWTPPYVLWTGGLAIMALLAAHRLIDQRGWPALGRRFGVNAITVYLGASVMSVLLGASGLWQAAWNVAAGVMPTQLATASLLIAVSFVAAWWAVAWWLDARRIYLKI